ncbi:hypothetical protein C0580_01825 [Candidatus Parcubacteria bacterium]|nr:MAG: hypothetical protein C0580_01825 [Candidatus Parcubacteria bacterium]
MALASVGYSDFDGTRDFILEHQNEDGGWSWSTTGESDSNDTAAAIMAILETGVDNNSTEINLALDYLQSTQNEDGGFGYDIESNSDGASTAWVIAALNKVGSDPSGWQIGENNPVSFLQSLEQEDGSYLWLPADETGSAMVTAYSLVALSDKFYPVNYIELEQEQSNDTGVDLRIEGPDDTVCLAAGLEADNVLDLLALGATVCNYDYDTQDSAYGVYVSSIDGIAGQGTDGWQYFVNWQGGTQAAGEYQLSDGDIVLWAYGGWPFYASRLELNETHIDTDSVLSATLSYFDGEVWQAQSNAQVHVGDQVHQADGSGQINVTIQNDGVYPVWFDGSDEYARSNREYVTVGSGIPQAVDLLVEVQNGSGPGDDIIAFSVSQSSINFGTLSAGQSAQTTVSLSNTGTADIYVEASIIGDSIFTENTSLNQSAWENYNTNIAQSGSSSVNVGLSLPNQLNTSGQKTGQLIFWAISN